MALGCTRAGQPRASNLLRQQRGDSDTARAKSKSEISSTKVSPFRRMLTTLVVESLHLPKCFTEITEEKLLIIGIGLDVRKKLSVLDER